jgi:putative transposase
MAAVTELGDVVGISSSCDVLGVARSTYYRLRRPRVAKKSRRRRRSHRRLSELERQRVLDELHSERFMDKAPREVYATLLDEGVYLCGIRTMYRILALEGELRERRSQLRHPRYEKPELLAVSPNEVWSWDITKLRGPVKWTYDYLYVILDIFSRYVVGWMVAMRESSALASRLIEDSCMKQGILEGQLTIHADRGSSMRSKTVAELLSDLGVTKTHSRPHVSDDNPFSESQFKTLKYRPDFPRRFGSIEDARSFCRMFFPWYNKEHYHSGLGLLTPEMVHYRKADEVIERRRKVLEKAYLAHPERFVNKPPEPENLPKAVWINPPDEAERNRGRRDGYYTKLEKVLSQSC